MDDKRYNGWTNYETWAVALWLDNDEGSYAYWRAEAQDCYDEAEGGAAYLGRKERAARTLAERLRGEIRDEGDPLAGQASLYADLLGAALGEVNWEEIAGHYVEDVEEEEDEPVEADAE